MVSLYFHSSQQILLKTKTKKVLVRLSKRSASATPSVAISTEPACSYVNLQNR